MMLFRMIGRLMLGLMVVAPTVHAGTFTFNTDPFAGTPVRSVPGRQIVTGDLFFMFNLASDAFAFDATAFGLTEPLNFFNGQASSLPARGINFVVLEDSDNDSNPLTPFGAAAAADLIASRTLTHGAGFFVYFNQSLDLPRLVYSTDLSSSDADLRILARFLNFNGQTGHDAMPGFTSANFEIARADSAVPEPATAALILPGLALCAWVSTRRRQKHGSVAAPCDAVAA